MSPSSSLTAAAGRLESAEDRAEHEAAVSEALDAGLARLLAEHEGGAREAVLASVTAMESHPALNAGRGAALAIDGTVSLDAGFMEGSSLRYGGVCGVTRCKHPVLLAERLAHEGDYGCFVGGPAADALAAELGVPPCEPEELITEAARRRHRRRIAAGGPTVLADTVGAVALDGRGRLHAAVSTGGTSLKRRGRIGDSPVVGAGFWADDGRGACVTTGIGEVLLLRGTARHCVELLDGDRAVEDAAAGALGQLVDAAGRGRTCGLIVVGRDGAFAVAHTSPHMSAGWATADGRRDVRSRWT